MFKKISVVFAIILLLASSLIGVAGAQETGTATPTDTPTQTESESSSDETETEEGEDVSVDIPLNELVRPEEDSNTADPSTVLIDLGQYGHIYDINWNREGDGFATVYFNLSETAQISLADGNFETPGGTSYASYIDTRLPEGEVAIRIQNDVVDKQQCVALNGAGTPANQQIIHCDTGAQESILDRLISVQNTLIVVVSLSVFTALFAILFYLRDGSDNGDPRTADGVEISENTIVGDVTAGDSNE